MIQLVALISCIGLICAAVPFDPNVHNERVIGGYDAERNRWKSQVSLQHNTYDDGLHYHICGGTLVDSYHVVTAAHCIISAEANLYRVVMGEHNIYEYEGTEQFRDVAQIFVHPGWTDDLAKGNDIALLRLVKPVYANGYVEVANLPYPGQMLPHNFICYITGWGLTSTESDAPAVLQMAPISVVEHSVCSRYEWWGSIALRTMICAGGDGLTSGCQGDSGGPLHCFTDGAWRVHGVVSYGPAGHCNQVSKPTVFTRISSFQDWMYSLSNTGDSRITF
ncbi:chymotrypsin-like elastase family member 1 [Diretmus argenteus]